MSVPPNITGVSPTSGAAGVQVTVSGSGFGSAQGTGTVWLGSALGTVVSWSDTQVVATVASNAASGNVQVQQGGAWSNAVPFSVATATISSVTPSSGVPGTVVTVAGSGFGAAQGSGQVWLGTVPGVVQSWSDAQVVAAVATGSATGYASVLQNGVLSNAVPFTVYSLQLTSVSPNSGAAGTTVTFTGAGFGASQGTGEAWLGGMDGQAVSWSDTQIVATVATGALTGIARVQQNGVWSNAVTFTVPGAGGLQLEPVLINMVVGDTNPMQAVNSAGQRVSGLTWASSDPTVASLSTDDPPVLTAVAAGHVTITAGAASADVTVWADPLPVGTVMWMNAGIGSAGAQAVPQALKAGGAAGVLGFPRGRFGATPRQARRRVGRTLSANPADDSGATSIVPAVPSPSGAADVFAFQNDGTVQAITSYGTTAWTAAVPQMPWGGLAPVVPDFRGGLVMMNVDQWGDPISIVGLDGMTGQPTFTYTPGSGGLGYMGQSPLAVHTDGTIFAIQSDGPGNASVVGIDPTAGALKFSVPLPVDQSVRIGNDLIIAGDGYAYVPYAWSHNFLPPGCTAYSRIGLLRIDSSGNYNDIDVMDFTTPCWRGDILAIGVSTITNADQGIWFSFEGFDFNSYVGTTTGAGASVTSAPAGGALVPVLQAQDGSFIGITWSGNGPYEQNMISFDAGGNVHWLAPGNWQPQIATADGGVIAINQDTGAATTFDQNGNARWLPTFPANGIPDWSAQVLAAGATGVESFSVWAEIGAGFASLPGGNPSGNGTSTLNLKLAESFPLFSLKSILSGGGVKCTLGTDRIPLTGAALGTYTSLRQQELTFLQSLTPASPCETFLLSKFPDFFAGINAAVANQIPFDGLLSNLSQYAAGNWTLKDQNDVEAWPNFQTQPVCGQFWDGWGIWSGVTAAAQAQPTAANPNVTDVYIDSQPNAYKKMTPVTILHEALHNLTRLGDDDLYRKLTGSGLNGRKSFYIDVELRKQKCGQ